VFQGAAALLIVLGEEVGLLGLFLALESRQGDFQGLADLVGFTEGEAQAEDQRCMQGGGEKQGEAQPVRRAYAGAGEFRWVGCCVHRVRVC
jgi:hypothetical protein